MTYDAGGFMVGAGGVRRAVSLGVAIAVLGSVLAVAGVSMPGAITVAGAIPGSSDPASAPLICGGSGTLDEMWLTAAPGSQKRFVRVWVPSGRTLTVSTEGEVSFAKLSIWWRAQILLDEELYEVGSTNPFTIWDQTFVQSQMAFDPNNVPAPVPFSSAPDAWTNTGASRYVLVGVSWDYPLAAHEFSTSIEVSGTPVEDVDCAALEASEFQGPNPALKNCPDGAPVQRSCADPVNTHSGNLHMPMPGLAVPGRGPGLVWETGYNSLASSSSGALGNGWSHSYGMHLSEEPDGTMLLHQETGATVRFWPDGSGWRAPSRATATLVGNVDGSFTVTRGHVEVFEFDSDGRLTGLSDLHGNTTSLVYSGSELDYAEDPAGRRLDFTWSGGRITQVTAPGKDSVTPQSVSLSYELDGDLASYTDTGGGVWSFSYDGSHRMLTMRKPANQGGAAGAVVENHYDTEGRVVWQDDELDNRTTFAYDTPVAGQTTVTETIDASASPPVTRTTIFTYEDGMATGVTVAAGTAQEATWTYEFDAASLGVVREVDPNGVVTEHEYDLAGNRVSTSVAGEVRYSAEFGALDLPVWVEDGEGYRTEYSWDTGNGNLLSVSANADAEDGDPVRTTTYTYGDPGHPEDVTSITDPEGKVWTYTYDPDTGDRIGEEDPLGNETTYGFNDAGWLTSVVSPRGNAPGATPADFTTTLDHDSAGRTIAVVDPEGGETERHYGTSGLLLWEEDASDNRTVYSYDPAGRVIEVERPDASTLGFEYFGDGSIKSREDGAGEATSYTYDPAGRMVTATDPLGRTSAYGYDVGGRRVWVQAHGGDCLATPIERCTTFAYNGENEVTSVTHSDDDGVTTPDVTGIVYDKAGRRTAMTDGTGASSWDWNPFGELESTTAGNGDVVAYTYDRRGLQTSITYPGNKTVTRAFDDAGRWTGLTDWLGGTGSFGYDESSNLEQITYPSSTGNVDTFSFDDADRLTGITYTQDATVLGGIDYGTRDANGRVTSVDATGLPGPDESYGYNPLDQLSQVNSAVLDYDAADNLIVRSDGASQAFDAANQLCWASPSGATGTCATAPSGATTYSYDDSGNRIAATGPGGTSNYVYDSANRLVAADGTTYTYDGDGLRASKTTTAPAPNPVAADAFGRTVANGWGTADLGGAWSVGSPNSVYSVTGGVAKMVTSTAGGGGQAYLDSVSAADVDITLKWSLDKAPTGGGTYAYFSARDVTAGTEYRARIHHLSNGEVDLALVRTVGHTETVLDEVTLPGVSYAANDVLRLRFSIEGSSPATLRAKAWPDGTTEPTAWHVTAADSTMALQSPGGVGVRMYVSSSATNTPTTLSIDDYTVTTSVAPPAGPVATDAFGRTASNGWGTADLGGVWSVGSPASAYSVTGGVAKMVTGSAGGGGQAYLDSVSAADVDITLAWSLNKAPTGSGTYAYFAGRDVTAGTEYRARVHHLSNGEVDLALVRTVGYSETVLDDVTITGLTYAANDVLRLRFSIEGSSPATLRAKVWADGTTEPTAWQATATDSTPALQVPGGVGVRMYVSSSATNTPTTLSIDDYSVTALGATAPPPPAVGTTDFTWDRSDPIPKLLTQRLDGGERTYVIYGPGGHPYAQITGTGVVYYHRDQIGSTRLLTDNSGNPVGSFSYDVYGKLIASTGTVTPLLGFAGEYTDTETGFTYLRARYYDPTTGQFLTRDPIEHTTGDAYGYAGSNPVAFVDPTGLCSVGGVRLGFLTNSDGGCRGAEVIRTYADDVSSVASAVGTVCTAFSWTGVGAGCATVATVVSTVSSVAHTVVSCADWDRACRNSALATLVGGASSFTGSRLLGNLPRSPKTLSETVRAAGIAINAPVGYLVGTYFFDTTEGDRHDC